MILYLLKMIACSAAFYALYHFVFQREKMLVFNRFYLMGSLVASFIIPLITFTVKAPPLNYQLIPVEYGNYQPVAIETVKYTLNDYLMMIAITIFVIVSAILLVRFFINIHKIQRTMRGVEKVSFKGATIVLLHEKVIPYSFLNRIFVNEQAYKQGRVEEKILLHELAHIRQKHSWDIIFIELLQIFLWFNPLIYLYKNAIRMNHEFLADEAVIKITNDALSYHQLLLQSVYVNNNTPLASSFFFTTKKRMIMLQKTTNKSLAMAKGLLTMPLLALLIFFLGERVYAQKKSVQPEPKIQSPTITEYQQISEKGKNGETISINYNDKKKPVKALIRGKNKNQGPVVEDISTPEKLKAFEKKYGMKLPPPPVRTVKKIKDPKVVKNKIEVIRFTPPKIVKDEETVKENPPPPLNKNRATQKEIEEYNAILKEMRVKTNDGRKRYKFIEGKTQRAAQIYKKMTKEQQAGVEMLPPPPPPPPPLQTSSFYHFNWTKKVVPSNEGC